MVSWTTRPTRSIKSCEFSLSSTGNSQSLITCSPWGLNDPTEGSRVQISNPWDTTTSEFGWQGTGSTTYTTSRGNNGIAQSNPDNKNTYLNLYRPTSATQNFSYPYTAAVDQPPAYVNASIIQLFYTSNMYHDLLHLLGFNERAGNFEINNNNQGGLGNGEQSPCTNCTGDIH
jgi:extracellular elastinolytic metalloproteinase